MQYNETELDRIKAKIAKLLNLAEKASNEHEAANAMAKARSLMDKYELSKIDILEVNGEKREMLKSDATRAYAACPLWMQTLAVAVATLNDCQAVFEGAKVDYRTENRPNARKKNWGKKIVFRGFRHDVELAIDMYARLIGALNNLFSNWIAEIGHEGRIPMSLNTNFKSGAVHTIRKVMNAAKEERQKLTTSGGTQLVVVKDNAVAEYFGTATYSTSKAKAFTNEESRDAFNEGRIRGHQVEVQRRVN